MTEWIESPDDDQVLTDGEYTIQILEHGVRLYHGKSLLYASSEKNVALAKNYADMHRRKDK